MRHTFTKNKTTFIFGNGGSSSIANHLATDISNKLVPNVLPTQKAHL